MPLIQSIILGLVQGLTEFLPVSSSAHLVLVPNFLGWEPSPVLFDIFLHLGTLVAVLVYFRKDILGLFSSRSSPLTVLIVACVPTAIIGFLFKGFFEKLFENPAGVSVLLLVTGFLLWFSSRRATRPAKLAGKLSDPQGRRATISYADALWIGIAQGAAIAPGISRSGATISTGLLRGLSGEEAARFSFLLSIPAILGALVFKLKDLSSTVHGPQSTAYMIGGAVAGLAGYGALKIVFKALKAGRFKYFALYCWALGTIGILSVLVRG